MSSDKLVPVPKLVWCSSSPDKEKKKCKKLAKEGYRPEMSGEPAKVSSFLKSHADTTFIVIMSGENKEESLQNIGSFENVAAVVWFDRNNEDVGSNTICTKVTKYFNRFTEVVAEVKALTQRYLLKAALDCTQQSEFKVAKSILDGTKDNLEQPSAQIAYYHFETGRVLDFKLISLLSTEQSTPDDILKELTAFLPAGSPGVLEIQERFKDYTVSTFNLMKEFCYVYSTELIYKEFNRACAARSYHKIIKTLAMMLKELQFQSNLVFRSNEPLYRGIPKGCMKAEDYEANRNGFWPSFTSTSRNIDIAYEFAGEGGFIFVITLCKDNVHPNVILNNDWSKYPRQEEVLLLPYFSVRTTAITKKDGYTFIYLEQNEKDSVLSLHDMTIWTQRIEDELIKSVHREVDRITRDFCSSINVSKILVSDKSKALFWTHIKSICNAVLSQQNTTNSWKAKLTAINDSKEVQNQISAKFKQEIPAIMSDLMKEFASTLHQKAKKSISDIIREELLLRPDIIQSALKGIEESLTQISLPWKHAVREIASNGVLVPFLRTFMSIISSSYRSSWEKELEEKVAGALWQGFCKTVDGSREDLNQCSQDLAKKYREFFNDTKVKLEKVVKDMIRRVKV